jgi:hypothetical protein
VDEDPNDASQVPSSVPLEWRPCSPYINSRGQVTYGERGSLD